MQVIKYKQTLLKINHKIMEYKYKKNANENLKIYL